MRTKENVIEDEAVPRFFRTKKDVKTRKIELMCKFYVYGYECLWKLRKKTCKCAHTSVVRDAFREY